MDKSNLGVLVRPIYLGTERGSGQSAVCAVDGCPDRPIARDLCQRHYKRWSIYGDPTVALKPWKRPGETVLDSGGYLRVAGNAKLHVSIVTAALGHPLGRRHSVHHVDGNKLNNENVNLVVCQDESYHQLLHYRARALRASGHADWRRCKYCDCWSAPSEMYVHPRKAKHTWHRECRNQWRREMRRNAQISAETHTILAAIKAQAQAG
jgi:hypothetical protein